MNRLLAIPYHLARAAGLWLLSTFLGRGCYNCGKFYIDSTGGECEHGFRTKWDNFCLRWSIYRRCEECQE